MLDVLEIVILTFLHVKKAVVLFLSPDVLGYFIMFHHISLLSCMIVNACAMIVNACALHWCLIEFQQALSETMETLRERIFPHIALSETFYFSHRNSKPHVSAKSTEKSEFELATLRTENVM